MYRIAVCEDELFFLESNIAMVREILSDENLREGEDFSVDGYDTLSVLTEKVTAEPEFYQLLLLDIVLGEGENGVGMATLLRKKNVRCGVIYITSHTEYVFQSFDTKPLQYLMKPVNRIKLAAAILDHYRETSAGRPLLFLGGVSIPIPVEEIFYLESIRHKIEVHLRDRIVTGNGPMSAVQKELPDKYFCRCHVGYLVNFAHVRSVNRSGITLDDGKNIPISRRLYQQTAEKYIEYLKL